MRTRKNVSSLKRILVCISLLAGSRLFAGDAVAVGYNSEGVWTAVTYYCSSTPKGGRDYHEASDAEQTALRDLRKRAGDNLKTASVLNSSDLTGYAAVARGKTEDGKEVNAVGRGKSAADAEKKAIAELTARGANAKQKIVYRYFSYGADSK